MAHGDGLARHSGWLWSGRFWHRCCSDSSLRKLLGRCVYGCECFGGLVRVSHRLLVLAVELGRGGSDRRRDVGNLDILLLLALVLLGELLRRHGDLRRDVGDLHVAPWLLLVFGGSGRRVCDFDVLLLVRSCALAGLWNLRIFALSGRLWALAIIPFERLDALADAARVLALALERQRSAVLNERCRGRRSRLEAGRWGWGRLDGIGVGGLLDVVVVAEGRVAVGCDA